MHDHVSCAIPTIGAIKLDAWLNVRVGSQYFSAE